MAPLVNASMRAADPSEACGALASNVEWMNGIQFYLPRNLPTAHGHVIHIDTEWALTSISQLQFWRDAPPEFFGQRSSQRPLGRRFRLDVAGIDGARRDRLLP